MRRVVGYLNSNLVYVCGLVSITSCVVVVVTHFVTMLLLDDYSIFADTISDLAAGRYGYIQDTGLVVFAGGMLACAVGLWRWKPTDDRVIRWGSVAAIVVVALTILIISVYNEYGNRDEGGVEIHIYLVYVLGMGFAVMTWLVGEALGPIDAYWRTGSRWLAVAWLVLAPPFLLLPTEWDGLYERFLGLILVGWVCSFGWTLLQQGRSAA